MSSNDSRKPNLIIANLDGESELSLLGTDRKPSPIKQSVLNQISLLGSLMRIYAHPDGRDYLWTPVPIDEILTSQVSLAPTVRLLSGPLSQLNPNDFEKIIPWLDTPSTDRLKNESRSQISLIANSKETCLNWSEDLELSLPGQKVVGHIEQLEEHLNTYKEKEEWTGSWILKARWSAAGRWRYISNNSFIEEGKERQSIENLFSQYGTLIFEPWQERLFDWGSLIEVRDRENIEYFGIHQQFVDGGGRIQKLRFYPNSVEAIKSSRGTSLDHRDYSSLMDISKLIGEKLYKLGYRGPVSIDAWKFKNHKGRVTFNPLGEINARFSLGRLALDWISHLKNQNILPEYKSITLESGKLESGLNDKQIVLIEPTGPKSMGTWLEIED